MDLQLKYAAATTKSVDSAKRTIEAIVSDETIDSYGDSIDTASWNLARYRSNPVVLFGHRTDQPIGQTTKIWIEGTQLHAIMVLSETERGREVMQLFADGALRAFSVGFRVGRVTEEVRGGRNVTRLHECELFEVSAVSIPANPSALVKHKAAGLVPPNHTLSSSSGADFLAEVDRRLAMTDEQLMDEHVRSIVTHSPPAAPRERYRSIPASDDDVLQAALAAASRGGAP